MRSLMIMPSYMYENVTVHVNQNQQKVEVTGYETENLECICEYKRL